MNPGMDAQEPASKADLKTLERLMTDYMESIEREIKDVHASLARIETRLDTQAIRLDRQGALLQVGSRWTTRMNGWAERVDRALESKDRELSDLRTRIEKLERRERPPGAAGPPAS
jgi:chromosome segregation ATPase